MNKTRPIGWLVLNILAILAIAFSSSFGCGSAATVAPRVDALAPSFTLPTLDAGPVVLQELRGQPVVVSFWATWCPACRGQMPYLQAAFQEKGQTVNFIAVNMGESYATVAQYVDAAGIDFTVAHDEDRSVTRTYNVRYYPTTFLVDEHGVIKHIRLGAFWDTDELMTMLEGL